MSSSKACFPRWATARTPGRKTLGHAAANVARALGTPLMPWQQQVFDVALELDPATGRLAYRQVVLTVPRQSGKTTLLLVLILLRALGAPRQSIRYTAQTAKDARDKWGDDWLSILGPSKFSSLFRTRLTNGHEALLFKNGSIQSLVATTEKSGHGSTIDLAILDEAFAHPDARLEQALRPAMITRPQPQLWVVSTAGTPDKSPYLWGKVEAGRQLAGAGVTDSAAYFEWSADETLDPSDPATWWSCMPALGLTMTQEAVAAEFASMQINEFERAFLNRWKSATSDPVIPVADWIELTDRESEALDPVCLAFDVTPDRAASSIAAAGRRPDGLMHVEIVDQGRGTGWVVDKLVALSRAHRPVAVVCDPAGPAGSLLSDLAARKVDVLVVNSKEHAQACGLLFDTVSQAGLRHLGTPELTAALDGAVKRPLGDAWAWSRKSSAVDISPLVAVTLALWVANTRRRSARVVDLGAVYAEMTANDQEEQDGGRED